MVSIPITGATMATNPANVFPLFARPREKDYREAVAKIIRDLMSLHGLTPTELGEEIGCCKETIENAASKQTSLNPVTFGNIRWRYGAEAVKPWDDICDRQVSEPVTLTERLDALERLAASIRREIGA